MTRTFKSKSVDLDALDAMVGKEWPGNSGSLVKWIDFQATSDHEWIVTVVTEPEPEADEPLIVML